MNPAVTPPDLAYRFGLVVLGLCQVVANHVNRDCSNEPFIARIYFSLRRRLKRFEQLFARAQAELVRSAARDAVTPDAQAPEPAVQPVVDTAGVGTAGGEARETSRKAYARLPRKRGWLTTMIPYKAALYWYRLDDVLRDPEMVAFLATSRQARRLLRPLWHALCGDPLPACLREPPNAVETPGVSGSLVGDGAVDVSPSPGAAPGGARKAVEAGRGRSVRGGSVGLSARRRRPLQSA